MSHATIAPVLGLDYQADCPGNIGAWKERHRLAVTLPRGPERPIVKLLGAWIEKYSELLWETERQ